MDKIDKRVVKREGWRDEEREREKEGEREREREHEYTSHCGMIMKSQAF